ncbi:transporter [Duganella vulcania]|uniref:Transporter n=1 Tax=Duganella vulcania TaxID=2692166 RepID=A0A845GNC8_9BURK|nr:transporter [Duganella vulcania]MYM95501.1 transporter [Duganella vulcania]
MTRSIFSAVAALTLMAGGTAGAAEGFEPRYNLAGSLGGELFAPPDQPGWAGALAVTRIHVEKVTGDDGRKLTEPIPGGVVPLPGAPAALYPSYAGNHATIDGTGTFTRSDLVLGYLTTDRYAGGRLAFVFDLPYARKQQSIVGSASTPALQWNPAVPAATQAAVQGQFSAQYQGAVAADGATATGELSGMGDVELQAGWLYVGDKVRVLAGGSVILPTGKYDSGPAPDIGSGHYTTLRPTLQLGYLPVPEVALAAKLSLGLNSRNHANQLRSGNWAGLELAAGYKTALGVVGLHAIHLSQYQDDDNNPLGASRFRSTNAGAFFTTRIAPIDAVVTVQYIATTASRNAKAGSFTQVRLIKLW